MSQLVRDDVRQTVHVRFDGRSEELPMSALHLNAAATDAEIKAAVASHLDRPAGSFGDYVVVRYAESVVIRPEALYG